MVVRLALPPRALWFAALLLAALSAGGGFWLARSIQPPDAARHPLSLGEGPGPPSLPVVPSGGTPRNVVLFVLDGFAFQHLALARLLVGGTSGGTAFDALPATGWQTTFGASGAISDSAASASAMSTGQLTRNGLLGVDAEGRARPVLAERLAARGIAIGLVTDTTLWDATPAAFVAHAARHERERIVLALAGSGARFLAGGHDGGDGSVPPVLRARFAAGRFLVATDLAAAAAAPAGERVVLLLPPRRAATPPAPPLAHLAGLALERLAPSPEGFFLLLESEEVDTASHRRDAAQLRQALTGAETALRRVLAFAAARGDTLVVVTGDHGTGAPVIVAGRDRKSIELRFGTSDHTADLVPVLAYGPAAERFAGSRAHTAIAGDLAALFGIAPPPAEPQRAAAGRPPGRGANVQY